MIENINIIIAALVSLLSALGGGGLVYFKQTKRLKAAEAAAQESKVENDEVARWRSLFEQEERVVALKDAKIDELYNRIHELEGDKHRTISKFNSAMTLIDGVKRCYCSKYNCTLREPPNDLSIEELERELERKGLILPVSTTEKQ